MTSVLRRNLRLRLMIIWMVLITACYFMLEYRYDLLLWVDQGWGCELTSLPYQLRPCGRIEVISWKTDLGIYAVMVMMLLLAGRALTAWCLRPVRDLVPVIAQVGPQNLGFRIATGGRRRDELADLSAELNTMMDRIASGYEGQRRFAANASHELRTPLAVQRTLIEVGMAKVMNADQLALVTAQLLETNERNERLIEGLLVLTEVEQGLAGSTPQQLDKIAATVVQAHAEQAARAGVTIFTDLARRTVDGEEVLLERLITNLVQNAIKYNRPGGTIHVQVAASPALTVTNTGPPVPADAVAGLFEPFKRLGSDRIDHSGGAGLGLAIARSIVHAHQGTISAVPGEAGGLRVETRLPEH
ncbi:HAMP domain-containing sensor histidine kinase [Actinoplanes sp. NPDC051346]|uniref:sensor histidine kinase n=1 Tax=Actinoplanes sp. NPDC051346 TaxID=3155048 RepID=UPI0034359396